MSKVQVVDENNRVIGAEEKSKVHLQGLWHRIVCVYVFNDKGQVLIQKRSVKTDVVPNLWDHSCAGHVDEGEVPKQAAKRELKEELNIDTDIGLIKEFKASEKVGPKTLNRFWYLYKTEANGPFEFDKEEVAEVKFVDEDWLDKDLVNNKSKYALGFLRSWENYKSIV